MNNGAHVEVNNFSDNNGNKLAFECKSRNQQKHTQRNATQIMACERQHYNIQAHTQTSLKRAGVVLFTF